MNFIKKYKIALIIIVLIVLFVVFAILTKDSNKIVGTELINNWYSDTLSTEPVVTVYAQTTCSHCLNFKPIIEEVKSENDFKLYWFELDTLTTNDYNTVLSTYNMEGYKGTPYTLITKNGSVVSYHSGEMSKTSLTTFLKDNGVID